MIPPETSPLMRRLVALYQATRLVEKGADFHGEMLAHAQELEKALSPPAAVPDLPKVEPAP